MNEHDTMKRLLEAVEEKPKALKVDDSNVSYSNAPNEQTIDHKTMNNVGDDLHKKKNHQFRSKPGDNPMAMTTVKVKQAESRLTKAYAQFLKEEEEKDDSAGYDHPEDDPEDPDYEQDDFPKKDEE